MLDLDEEFKIYILVYLEFLYEERRYFKLVGNGRIIK